MSSEDYAIHLAQKYRLAISIAILNTKPQKLSIDEYIDQLKKTSTGQINDDFNVSVCSDDFRITNTEFENQNVVDDGNHFINESNDDNVHHIGDNDGGHADFSNSEGSDDATKVRQNKFRDMIDMLKGVDVSTEQDPIIVDLSNSGIIQNQPFDLTQYDNHDTFYESIGAGSKQHDKLNKKVTLPHNSELIDKLAIIDKAGENIFKPVIVQKKPVEDLASCQEMRSNFENTKLKKKLVSNEEGISKPKIAKTNHLPNNKTDTKASKYKGNLSDANASNNSFIAARHQVQTPASRYDKTIDTQETVLNTQKNTHYSQSQNLVTVDRKYLYNDNIKQNDTEKTQANNNGFSQSQQNDTSASDRINVTENVAIFSQNTQNMVEYLNENAFTSNNEEGSNEATNINIESYKTFSQDYVGFYQYERKGKIQNVTENDLTFSQDSLINLHTYKPVNMETEQLVLGKAQISKDMINKDSHKTSKTSEDTTRISNIDTTTQHTTNNNRQYLDEETIQNVGHVDNVLNRPFKVIEENKTHKNFAEDTQKNITDAEIDLAETQDTIPFKVMEEMNKVRVYLNRRERLSVDSSDTGYRSSSQSKCSLKSSQASSTWLNQSATSLFTHITTCTLATQHFTEQISEVLGQLIDRLHEDEMYPTFLEQLLEIVNNLLQQIYEENCDENMILIKDEQIQRVLLLNKSKHIQKFTIEKLNYILQNLLNETLNTDHEINNIYKIENACYIFHILQVVLQNYCSENSSQTSQEIRKNSSQSTQSSQDLRKSDIYDIWRRKWIPNYKETSEEGVCEEKCVLKECGNILNNIIIDFMDGYSLVAYSALKCFNVMQN